MSLRTVTLVVGSCYAQVALVTHRMLELLRSLGCDDTRAQLLVIGVGELVNNIIEHAFEERSGHDILVEIQADDVALHLRVTDHGRPVPDGLFEGVRAPRVDPDDVPGLPEGGMGLYIARQLFHQLDWRNQDGANVLSATALLSSPLPV
ncbi:MAG: ATP-binding protein [Myxococcales bacterium]|nr:ATP-binding protein [Myxococcales bacterium]MCB9671829.1 ATP-binding protein [Alphaproteobacteria bacterium]